MSLTVTERNTTRTFIRNIDGDFISRLFLVKGTDDTEEAVGTDAIKAGLPKLGSKFGDSIFFPMYAFDVRAEILKQDGDADGGIVEVTVQYKRENLFFEQPDFSFDTSAQQTHIQKAISQVHFPDTADKGQLIGVVGDDIQGVDIFEPSVSYEETHDFFRFSQTYRRLLVEYTGTVNEKDWKGYVPGEVLFLGARATKKRFRPWRVNFKFLINPNIVVVVNTFKDGTLEVPKEGFDYIWYSYAAEKPTDKTKPIKQHILSAHVSTVYEKKEFSQLGIGEKVEA